MKKMKYTERLPVSIMDLRNQKQTMQWLKEKNMKAYTFNPPKNNLLQIDIIIEDSFKFSAFNKKKNIKKMGALKIPVVSIKDIIKMKKKTIQKIGFDQETLERWKKSSVKAKFIWLESALKFGKTKKF